jgi:hypothetical protein
MTQHAPRSTPPLSLGGERYAEGALQESTWHKMGKDRPLAVALNSPEPFAPTRGGEPPLDPQDPVGVPSRGLVDAWDDCVASLNWSNPDWIKGGVGDRPRQRDPSWHLVAGRIPFYCLILAVSGLFGWLVDVALTAVAK